MREPFRQTVQTVDGLHVELTLTPLYIAWQRAPSGEWKQIPDTLSCSLTDCHNKCMAKERIAFTEEGQHYAILSLGAGPPRSMAGPSRMNRNATLRRQMGQRRMW